VNPKVKLLTCSAKTPQYAKPFDVGMDLMADESLVIPTGEWRSVRTGIALEIPPSLEGQIRSRSGLAAKYGVTVLNSPGTIDSGYRGEVIVILMNHSPHPFQIIKGARIAQMVFAKVVRPPLSLVNHLSESERGVDGLGSTGL
jgi:dUTP pyrophosphatase